MNTHSKNFPSSFQMSEMLEEKGEPSLQRDTGLSGEGLGTEEAPQKQPEMLCRRLVRCTSLSAFRDTSPVDRRIFPCLTHSCFTPISVVQGEPRTPVSRPLLQSWAHPPPKTPRLSKKRQTLRECAWTTQARNGSRSFQNTLGS